MRRRAELGLRHLSTVLVEVLHLFSKGEKATFPNTRVKPAFRSVESAYEYDVRDTLEDDVGDAEEISGHFDNYNTYVVKNPHDKRFENAIKA
jgi:hypothetical protein